MGRTVTTIDERTAGFIESQPIFFVASAPLDGDGHVNCSPKGNRGELVVFDPRRVGYLDQTGSGIETVAHLQENGRLVLMVCAFAGPPRILRLHGTGEVVGRGDERFPDLLARFPRFAEAGPSATHSPVDVGGIAEETAPRAGAPGGGETVADEEARGGGISADGVRAVVVLKVVRVADSCGYGVPLMSFEGHRRQMDDWARRKGPDGLQTYRDTTNAASIDGLTGLR